MDRKLDASVGYLPEERPPFGKVLLYALQQVIHSGNSWRAFFNDLYKLSKGDYAYVTYKNKKYAYKIVNIYKQDKVGTIGIYRDYNKTTLTLVTCTNYESTTQTVYIAELQEVTDN